MFLNLNNDEYPTPGTSFQPAVSYFNIFNSLGARVVCLQGLPESHFLFTNVSLNGFAKEWIPLQAWSLFLKILWWIPCIGIWQQRRKYSCQVENLVTKMVKSDMELSWPRVMLPSFLRGNGFNDSNGDLPGWGNWLNKMLPWHNSLFCFFPLTLDSDRSPLEEHFPLLLRREKKDTAMSLCCSLGFVDRILS